jgi:uncharacterized membrane protein
MKVVLLVVALAVSAALAGAVTYVASSSRAVAAHEPVTSTPVWQTGVVFPDGAIPSEEVQADLDGNASALVASADSDIEPHPQGTQHAPYL